MAPPESKTNAVEAVVRAFSERLPARIDWIVSLWDSCRRDKDKPALFLFQADVHKLKGTTATYGYSLLAKSLERIEVALIEFRSTDSADFTLLAATIETDIALIRDTKWLPDDSPGNSFN